MIVVNVVPVSDIIVTVPGKPWVTYTVKYEPAGVNVIVVVETSKDIQTYV